MGRRLTGPTAPGTLLLRPVGCVGCSRRFGKVAVLGRDNHSFQEGIVADEEEEEELLVSFILKSRRDSTGQKEGRGCRMVLYSSFGADRAVLAQLRDRGGPQVD